MTVAAVWRVVADPLVAAVGDGPLTGQRVAVKDLFAVAGHAIGAGNPTWLAQASVEVAHADVVATLIEAGAEVRGITQTDEFGYGMFGVNPHHGTPPNPAAPGRVPGGSSSGAASAVASGEADIGVGTDTAGSVRAPASFCGLHGFRPSHGAVEGAGRLDLAPSFDTVGWLTRDAALLAQVGDLLLPSTTTPPIRELLLATDLLGLLPESLGTALNDAARRTAALAGLPLREVDTGTATYVEEWAEALGILQAVEMWATYGDWVGRHSGAASPLVEAGILAGGEIPDDYLKWAQETHADARRVMTDLVPVGTGLVQPAMAGPAPRVGTPEAGPRGAHAHVRFLCAASLAGLPVLTIPAVTDDGAPVGLSILAAAGADRALLDVTRPIRIDP